MKRYFYIIDSLIVCIIIIFLRFFSFKLIPDDSAFGYPAIIIIGLVLFLGTAYFLLFQKKTKKSLLDKVMILFIICFVLSAFMSYSYWDQSFLSSLKSYNFFYVYCLYFILLFLKISKSRVERLVIIFFFISLLIFFIDFMTYPKPLFSWRDEERRNGITVFFFGQGFTFLGGFYYLNQFFSKKKLIFLLFACISFFCLYFLTQSRLYLIAVAVGSLFLLLCSDFKNKYLITLLLIISSLTIYYNSSIFDGIKEENKTQAENYKDDIRLSSQKYFIDELQGGVTTMLFGNGVPEKNSRLNRKIQEGSVKGYFIADVGITGIYSYFGMLGVILWFSIFYIVFKSKNNLYIKAYFITLLTTILTGYSIFDPGYMPATILALYIIRV